MLEEFTEDLATIDDSEVLIKPWPDDHCSAVYVVSEA